MIWLLLPMLGLLLLAAALYLRHYMLHVEPNRIEITQHEVLCPDLPPELDGLVLCQVSDLHIAGHPRNEAAVAEAIRSVRADLYVFTGDMIYLQDGIPRFFRWLDALGDAARPAVAVLGNAENKSHVRREEVEHGLAERDIPLLNNAVWRFPFRGAQLQIVGVDDSHTWHSDFPRAYAAADPSAWTLLLCHSPDGIMERNGYRADLMLCGHTHGGQICLPGIGALTANTERVQGLVAGWYADRALSEAARSPIQGTRMYISRGLGGGYFPGRLGCRPELPVFRLRRAEAMGAAGATAPVSDDVGALGRRGQVGIFHSSAPPSQNQD